MVKKRVLASNAEISANNSHSVFGAATLFSWGAFDFFFGFHSLRVKDQFILFYFHVLSLVSLLGTGAKADF